jgi:hypothetical protein
MGGGTVVWRSRTSSGVRSSPWRAHKRAGVVGAREQLDRPRETKPPKRDPRVDDRRSAADHRLATVRIDRRQ